MSDIRDRIGFIQGRLVPQIDGKIQAFPAPYWKEELTKAHALGFHLMEWTLDYDGLYENPFLAPQLQPTTKSLLEKNKISVLSVTADFFMHRPFHKFTGAEREQHLQDIKDVLKACAFFGTRFLVIPLVDNGRMETPEQAEVVRQGLLGLVPYLREQKIQILFEYDLAPPQMTEFIQRFPNDAFGINFDIGNSAALGFDPYIELSALGPRVLNVHVKDRKLHGTTVPLGTGNADLPRVFSLLKQMKYSGPLILQTARASDGRHEDVLCQYRDMVEKWLE